MKIAFFILLLLFLSVPANAQRMKDMKVKLTFENKDVIIKLYDNSISKELYNSLPMRLEFEDYARKEKISYFPKPLALANAPTGAIALKGEVTIFKPWGNLAFFYKKHSSSADPSLIPIGRIESGVDFLESQTADFTAVLKKMEEAND